MDRQTDKQMKGQAVRQTDRRMDRKAGLGQPELPGGAVNREIRTINTCIILVFRGAHIEMGMFVLIVSNKHI